MNTRRSRNAGLGVAACLVLVLGGCGADATSPDDAPGSSPAATGSAGSPSPSAGTADGEADRNADGESGGGPGGSGAATTGDSDSSVAGDAGDEAPDPPGDGDGDGASPGTEGPPAPEAPVTGLAELLPPADPAPLVTSPLPRAASARGRLVRRFPAALRPTRSAAVQSSSVSPSGDRLQVGLVASTALSASQVLLAYRTRLARRGLVETAAPPAVAGSQAAAFRRGGSIVTVTVTPRGSGATYSLHASLRAGRG
ncbi:hypothetical protein [Nocardioides sp. zg-1228]|uniref:hypothetical protein n=1 Tax=Nocardioides sp. zg-1228 TaxID=2763008 RepID=UPI001642DD86|nr:hypothetical protein [Nocardioides sp. zg-1228]MBC2931404.1 hypothetical protein [Nocardioides sp. zg-1228]QSF57021.1 hypothetical protein JX575_15770 [Nocardioides sp. zg-1228]